MNEFSGLDLLIDMDSEWDAQSYGPIRASTTREKLESVVEDIARALTKRAQYIGYKEVPIVRANLGELVFLIAQVQVTDRDEYGRLFYRPHVCAKPIDFSDRNLVDGGVELGMKSALYPISLPMLIARIKITD